MRFIVENKKKQYYVMWRFFANHDLWWWEKFTHAWAFLPHVACFSFGCSELHAFQLIFEWLDLVILERLLGCFSQPIIVVHFSGSLLVLLAGCQEDVHGCVSALEELACWIRDPWLGFMSPGYAKCGSGNCFNELKESVVARLEGCIGIRERFKAIVGQDRLKRRTKKSRHKNFVK